MIIGEKGCHWCKLTIKGEPGHASQPLRTDNALVRAAEVVRRIDTYRPKADLHPAWRRFIEELGFPEDLTTALLDPDEDRGVLRHVPRHRPCSTGACVHPHDDCSHHSSRRIEDQRDPRPRRARARYQDASRMGNRPRFRRCSRTALGISTATWRSSSCARTSRRHRPADTPLWAALERAASSSVSGLPARALPHGRGHRRADCSVPLGTVAYGFGLFSERLGFENYSTMFHGVDERVDVESLELSGVPLGTPCPRHPLGLSRARAKSLDRAVLDQRGLDRHRCRDVRFRRRACRRSLRRIRTLRGRARAAERIRDAL